MLVTVYIVILHLAGGHLIEQFTGAVDFCLLNGLELQAFHCAFGFCHKVDVLYRSFIEGDCPVGRIVTHRCGDVETSRQLGVDADFLGLIKILSEAALDTVLRNPVRKHIVLNGLVGTESLIKVMRTPVSGKDAADIEYIYSYWH